MTSSGGAPASAAGRGHGYALFVVHSAQKGGKVFVLKRRLVLFEGVHDIILAGRNQQRGPIGQRDEHRRRLFAEHDFVDEKLVAGAVGDFMDLQYVRLILGDLLRLGAEPVEVEFAVDDQQTAVFFAAGGLRGDDALDIGKRVEAKVFESVLQFVLILECFAGLGLNVFLKHLRLDDLLDVDRDDHFGVVG